MGLRRLLTSREGVFACGVFQGPKDIPETVVQAGAAAEAASAFLAEARGTLTRTKEYPPERDVTGQAPRIGVFVCHCGINIGGVVDVPAVNEYARTLPGVVYVDENLYTCSQDTQEKIKKAIDEHGLNRVVVASCSPRTHEPLFQETIREAGLNKYLFEMANIRDQCSWVHMQLPREATAKAKDLLRMVVAKARLIDSLDEPTMGITKKALVIGGGLAGMKAALGLARQGFASALVEKEETLGGNLRHIHHTLEGKDVQELLRNTVREVLSTPAITVYTGAEVKSIDGYLGNFKSVISAAGKEEEYEHGVVIVAVGAGESRPDRVSLRPGQPRRYAGRVRGAPRPQSRRSEELSHRRHDPVRRVAHPRASQLQPDLLFGGGKKCPEAQGACPPRGDHRPVPRHPHLRLYGALL